MVNGLAKSAVSRILPLTGLESQTIGFKIRNKTYQNRQFVTVSGAVWI
jgi:hypothetical protein